jgi:hypothetical protein
LARKVRKRGRRQRVEAMVIPESAVDAKLA